MLSEAQIREFAKTGYLVVPGLFETAEMRTIAAWTEAVAAWPETPGKWMKYFEDSRTRPGQRILCRMEDFEPYHPGFSELFVRGRMHAVVSDLFGEPALLFKDKINFKLPGGEGFKAHQDVQAGWDAYAPIHVTALVTIDPCTPENGCLEMAVYEHRKQLIGEKWKPLDEDALPYRALPTEPGDAVFFDSFIPHRSGPNMTSSPRRVLYVTYNARSGGDHRRDYYNDKRRSYPPDCEREPGKQYLFRV
ncbi:MAG: phytanoyl-CoA dioxygenase family protein [Gammaproteobacteria bacterium]|nr:phytanoyl-CoA dioxygenase family protein [Gammaproteobacteria bacterium]